MLACGAGIPLCASGQLEQEEGCREDLSAGGLALRLSMGLPCFGAGPGPTPYAKQLGSASNGT